MGLQRLTYKGAVLEDLTTYPKDGLHIWHMKMTTLDGKLLTAGQYGWGENHAGRSWDRSTHAWMYRFSWGSIAVRFLQTGDRLDIQVTEQNDAGSGVILDGAAIYPLVLHLPQTPAGWSGAAQLAFNDDAPSVTSADYGSGEVIAVVPDVGRPLYTGFVPASEPNALTPILSGTALDQMPAFQAHRERPVAPGETDTFTLSLRFAASGTDPGGLAKDVYRNWARVWPTQLHWPDRRMIGTIYLATSSRAADANTAAGYPNNPRRYFNDSDAADFDVRTAAGLDRFQQRLLRQANDAVDNLRKLNAQGAITWDIEGEEYPQQTSYVCSPDQIAQIAPEMESTIHDPSSSYAGMKLVDAWFRTFHDAGLRTGVCVRPQRFVRAVDGKARQVPVPESEVTGELIRKMRYAHDRWGVTLFYLDSTVRQDGSTLDASILQQVAAALPDSLLIPEESTLKTYAYTAPLRSFLFHGDLGTDAVVRRIYPEAFSVNLVNDVDSTKLHAARGELIEALRRGDILMPHADYWHPNNKLMVLMYKDAKATN